MRLGSLFDGPIHPEYVKVVQALVPLLYKLPPKLIAIDGWWLVGKTTLGRFLSWRFNVSLLETDLFSIREQGKHVYLNDQITRIIDARLQSGIPRPIIVEGTTVLRLLAQIDRSPDFVIYISNTLVEKPISDSAAEVIAYENEFKPQDRADVAIVLDGPKLF